MNPINKIGTAEFSEDQIAFVANVMRSGFISHGKETEIFEDSVSKMHGKKYGVFVNSGQSALEVSIHIAKLVLKKDNLKIGVPATTYAATLWAILQQGCQPVFYDINHRFVINPQSVDVNSIDVLIPVDLCGYTAYDEDMINACRQAGVFIIEDACEAFGNKYARYGDIICHSFYVSHHLTTGCGGMLSFDSISAYDYAKSYIAHGRVYGGDFTKYQDKWYDRFLFDKVGVSLRNSNIAAAMGLTQLDSIPDSNHKRQQHATLYTNILGSDPRFIVPNIEYIEKSVFQFYPILLDGKIDRIKFCQYLYLNGIESRVLFSLTNQPALKSVVNQKQLPISFPISTFCNDHGLIIGCHQNLTNENIEQTCECILNYENSSILS